MTATEKPKLTRRTRVALIAAAVLALAGVCIVLANVASSPPPKQYKVIDTGYDVQTLTAKSLSISVDSTLPEGASCRLEGPNGEAYVNHARADGGKVVTATCATK
jgi:hypothetical protein